MKETTSPIGNPARKWLLVDSYFLSIRGSDEGFRLFSSKTKTRDWVGRTDAYCLDDPQDNFRNEKIVVCHVFCVFGKEAVMQHWGFLDEIETNAAKQAVYLKGKWYLVEEDDELEFTTKETHPPFKTVTIAMHTKEGVLAQEYSKK